MRFLLFLLAVVVVISTSRGVYADETVPVSIQRASKAFSEIKAAAAESGSSGKTLVSLMKYANKLKDVSPAGYPYIEGTTNEDCGCGFWFA